MKITKSTFLILGQNIQWEDKGIKLGCGVPLVLGETLFYEFLLTPSIKQMLMGWGTPPHTNQGTQTPPHTMNHTHTTPKIKPLTIQLIKSY